MPLATCQSCRRRFEDDGEACPYCGAEPAPPTPSKRVFGGGQRDYPRWMNAALAAVAVLVAVNVWSAVRRDVGPDREVEALHSEEDAVGVCSDAVESRFAARFPAILGPGPTEYLQGGEYEVRLEIALRDGARRTRAEVLCELQFTAETGWIVEDVSLDPN